MKLTTIFRFAFKNIWGQSYKAILSITGVIISVALLVFLVSLGYGIDKMVTDEISAGKSNNIITVTSGDTYAIKLTSEASKNFTSIVGVDKVLEIINLQGKFSYKGTTTDTLVTAVSPDYFDYNGIKLPDDVRLSEVSANEPQPIIINNYLAKLFGFTTPKNFVGEEVNIDLMLQKNQSKELEESDKQEKRVEAGKFRVAAVINRGDSPFLYVPHSVVSKGGMIYNTSAQVVVRNSEELPSISAMVESRGYKTESNHETINQVKNFFSFFRIFLFVLGFVVFIVSSIGLLNVQDISLAEKNSEFAWLKIIGGRDIEIKLIIVCESIMLAVTGGTLGLALGSSLGYLIDIIISGFAEQHNYSYSSVFFTPSRFAISLIVMSFIVGIGIGLIPARKSSLIKAKSGIKRAY